MTPDRSEERAAPRLSRRSLVLRGGGTVALVALMVVAVLDLVPGVGRRLDHVSAGAILTGIGLELISLAGYATVFHRVFSHGAYRFPFRRTGRLGVGELGAYAIVPTGLGGAALRLWVLVRDGMPFAEIMARSVVHVPILNLPYILAALVLGIGVLVGIGPGHAPTLVALAPLGVVLVIITGTAAVAWYVATYPAAGGGRWQRYAREALESVPAGVRQLPARLREPSLLVCAVAFWAGDCGVLVLAVHAVGGSAPVLVVVLAYMLGQLGNLLPLPGGVGGVEPLTLGVLTASGIGVGVGASAIVLYRLISLGLQATVGGGAAASFLLDE